ncbi:MAG: hypothetical protein CFE23_16165 [Flavobacterium sp. BFFFF1]|uniref:hypothetical protein n=1 Tax=Flavobacterium sp. BFFFF1 TaxID=2015557 RepID=UPI000BD308DB|nr:hypothetical protein [Flavobacterium sp. BFFFF1]OYU78991.1 MAG: hypothetical protein CFE23_16165 [Flavobacterium sp. BFFFF1]
MKLVVTIFLSVILAKSCNTQQHDEMKKANIEYQAVSRGYYLAINIQNDLLTIANKRDAAPKEYKLSDSERDALSKLFLDLKLDALSTYEGPTQKRFYDGAPIANMRVVYEGKTYETQSFDHGYPPKEIEAFVNKIVSFSNPAAE